jgi:predicted O-methyltransferase YrrM
MVACARPQLRAPDRRLASLRYTLGTSRNLVRAARHLRRAAKAARDPADVVDAVFGTSVPEVPIQPVQIRSELIDLLTLLRAERPRRVLEIGTGLGGTLYLLSWAAAGDARLLSLDLREQSRARRFLYRSFARGRQRLAAWIVDSHAAQTRAAAERFFRHAPVDVLFIDGDHSYDGVRRDYELYAPLVRPGGVIAFHDIVDGPETAVGEVPRFWREVSATLSEPVELVESWSQGGYGIGVGRVAATPQVAH